MVGLFKDALRPTRCTAAEFRNEALWKSPKVSQPTCATCGRVHARARYPNDLAQMTSSPAVHTDRLLVAALEPVCAQGPHMYARKASVWEACCWHSGVINIS